VPTIWRIVKPRYAARAFDGEGARLYGGRWNSPGVAMVYAAGSQSLAALELLVHMDRASLLSAYSLIPCEADADLLARTIDRSTLPPDWRVSPPPQALAAIGDAWIRDCTSVALAVPSAVVPDEPIHLLNPAHPAFDGLRIGTAHAFELDARLIS
jgi:RES domain-containing protein